MGQWVIFETENFAEEFWRLEFYLHGVFKINGKFVSLIINKDMWIFTLKTNGIIPIPVRWLSLMVQSRHLMISA